MTEARRPVAVVTGASSGLGRAYAERLAARGHDLVVVARRAERLEALADELRSATGVRVDVVLADLTQPDAPAGIVAELHRRGLTATVLVNAAGFGTAGRFADEDPARIAQEIAVDVTALTVLSRLLLPDLLAAPDGILLMISSTAGHQPSPNLAVYAACKAYVTSLTAAIWQETRGSGLRVLALCPGPTATEFFAVAGARHFQVGSIATIEQVVDFTFRAVDRRGGGPVATHGLGNRIQSFAARLAPRRLVLAIADRATTAAGLRGEA